MSDMPVHDDRARDNLYVTLSNIIRRVATKHDEVVTEQDIDNILWNFTAWPFSTDVAAYEKEIGEFFNGPRAAARDLLRDYLEAKTGLIGEFSGNIIADYDLLRSEGQQRAALLDLEWNDALLPAHVVAMLEFAKEQNG